MTASDDRIGTAAELLADAWGPALDRSYRLGYGNGYDHGFRAAELEMAESWARIANDIRDRANDRSYAELVAVRARHDHEPCRFKCGRCSACIHAEAWHHRGGRDYQGVEVERLIAAAQVAS